MIKSQVYCFFLRQVYIGVSKTDCSLVCSQGNKAITCFIRCTAGIRGEDAGILMCYKVDQHTLEHDRGVLQLKVLGIFFCR